jgi:predicted ester cyclase
MAVFFNRASASCRMLVRKKVSPLIGERRMSLEANKQIAISSFRVIESDDPELAHEIIAQDFINLEAADDPDQPDRNLNGPAGFLATRSWLRSAFSDLRFEDLETIAEANTVVVLATMTGRHTGVFQGIPPAGQSFRQRQIHVFRLQDAKIVEHRARRDDLGLLLHLGWHPHGP